MNVRGVQVAWATVVEKNVLMMCTMHEGIDEPSISINHSVTWWDEVYISPGLHSRWMGQVASMAIALGPIGQHELQVGIQRLYESQTHGVAGHSSFMCC